MSLTEELLDDTCCMEYCGCVVTTVSLFHGCADNTSWREGGIKSGLKKWSKKWTNCDASNKERSALLSVRERLWVGLLLFPSLFDLVTGILAMAVLLVIAVIIFFFGFVFSVLLLLCCEPALWKGLWPLVGKLVVGIINFLVIVIIAVIMIVLGIPLGIILLPVSYLCCGKGEESVV